MSSLPRTGGGFEVMLAVALVLLVVGLVVVKAVAR